MLTGIAIPSATGQDYVDADDSGIQETINGCTSAPSRWARESVRVPGLPRNVH